MTTSLFDVFEGMQPNPFYFNWQSFSDVIEIPKEDILHSGILTTMDKSNMVRHSQFLILTTRSLIESKDFRLQNPVNTLAILYLRNPRIYKIQCKETKQLSFAVSQLLILFK